MRDDPSPSHAGHAGDRHPAWAIGIAGGTSVLGLRAATTPVLSRDDVHDVRAHFVADPFMVSASGGWVMWFEVFEAGRECGVIGTASSDDGAVWRYDGIVLREAFHLSYPCVVPWHGEHYMVPETLALGGIHLYHARRFPDVWRRECRIVEGTFADPTLVRVEDGWAMFACGRPRAHDVLHLFVADTLTGPWREHPASPVVRDDPRRGRPGGRPVVDQRRCIRFAQDCAARYGGGLRALHVVTLDETRYVERDLDVAPIAYGAATPWCAGGVHHVDAHPRADGRWLACHDGRPRDGRPREGRP